MLKTVAQITERLGFANNLEVKSLHNKGYCEFQRVSGFALISIDYVADDELNEPYGINFIKINNDGISEPDFFTSDIDLMKRLKND